MSRWHEANGTVREIAETIGSILDGALMNPANVHIASVALEARHSLRKARTHEQVATAAVRGTYFLAKYGDVETADLIRDVMEGRGVVASAR